jgi:hypothetical protein
MKGEPPKRPAPFKPSDCPGYRAQRTVWLWLSWLPPAFTLDLTFISILLPS